MRYEFVLPVPASTTEEQPVTLDCKLTHGVVSQVRLLYPPECSGLVHVRVRDGGHQIWPTNPEGSFISNPRGDEWNEYYEMYEDPHELRLEAWNEDDTYEHTIYLSVILIPQAVAERGSELLSAFGRFFRTLFGGR